MASQQYTISLSGQVNSSTADAILALLAPSGTTNEVMAMLSSSNGAIEVTTSLSFDLIAPLPPAPPTGPVGAYSYAYLGI